jgi:hypothetical protein
LLRARLSRFSLNFARESSWQAVSAFVAVGFTFPPDSQPKFVTVDVVTKLGQVYDRLKDFLL